MKKKNLHEYFESDVYTNTYNFCLFVTIFDKKHHNSSFKILIVF
jgi:hypothetical protein